jgi:Tfp pilus assembly protein PilO
MDRQSIALLIPILALSIPVMAIISSGLQKVWRLRIEEARVRAGALAEGAEAELDHVRVEVEQLRRELTEVQERLDFAERLLARKAEPPPLPGAPRSPAE